MIYHLKRTPDQKIGIRAIDKILNINDSLISDLTINEVVNLIREPKGRKVVLKIFRKD